MTFYVFLTKGFKIYTSKTKLKNVSYIFCCQTRTAHRYNSSLSVIRNVRYWKLTFEIALSSKLFEHLDCSHEYFDIFQARDENIKKQVGLYKTEAIDNPTMISIIVNPKEYKEHYQNKDSNKRQRGVCRGTTGMTLEALVSCISSLQEHEDTKKLKSEKN